MVNLTSEYEEELPPNHFQYRRLRDHVRETIPTIKITSIREVKNKYLSLAFEIRKSEMGQRKRTQCEIKEYLHATGAAKIPNILKENLNWRLVTRSKYGKGTSFTHSASYANKYCNNRNGAYRAFIFCDVLVGNTATVYDNNDTHPPRNIDSYLSGTGFVLVKFDDFTYTPKFVVYYENGAWNPQYHDMDYRHYSNDETNRYQHHQQRTLLAQILRTPLGNEDFLNEIALLTAKQSSMIAQPASKRLSRPGDIVCQGGEDLPPGLLTAYDFFARVLPPHTDNTPNVRPTVPNSVAAESGRTNMPHSPRYFERTSGETEICDTTCKIISIILVIVVIIVVLFNVYKK